MIRHEQLMSHDASISYLIFLNVLGSINDSSAFHMMENTAGASISRKLPRRSG